MRYFFLITMFVLASNIFAQVVTERPLVPATPENLRDENVAVQNENTDVDKKIYNQNEVEQAATFPGGMDKFYAFVAKTLKQDENDYVGRVLVSFTIEQDGKLTNVKLRGNNILGEEAATNLMRKCPNWIPARLNGKTVTSTYNIPINFSTK